MIWHAWGPMPWGWRWLLTMGTICFLVMRETALALVCAAAALVAE